jgi:cation transport regulator ChaC
MVHETLGAVVSKESPRYLRAREKAVNLPYNEVFCHLHLYHGTRGLVRTFLDKYMGEPLWVRAYKDELRDRHSGMKEL